MSLKVHSYINKPLSLLRPINFCIWHSGRCGSTVLTSMLNQHPNIYCGGELLEKYSKIYEALTDKSQSRSGVKWRILRNILKGGTKVSGFEMKIWHLTRFGLEVKGTMDFLNEIGYNKHIVLERQNYLRVIVSGHVLQKTSRSHITSENQTSLTKIYLNPKQLKGKIGNFLDFYRELKVLLGDNCLWLLYEKDILQEPKVAFQKVNNFFGLKDIEPQVSLKKTNPYPLQKIILNFEEVAAELKNTDNEWMLFH